MLDSLLAHRQERIGDQQTRLSINHAEQLASQREFRAKRAAQKFYNRVFSFLLEVDSSWTNVSDREMELVGGQVIQTQSSFIVPFTPSRTDSDRNGYTLFTHLLPHIVWNHIHAATSKVINTKYVDHQTGLPKFKPITLIEVQRTILALVEYRVTHQQRHADDYFTATDLVDQKSETASKRR